MRQRRTATVGQSAATGGCTIRAVIVEREVVAGPSSGARLRACVSRIRRAHARAGDLLEDVFGISAVVDALDARVQRTADADEGSLLDRASELHLLVTWLSAVAESIELESDSAADLRPHLAVILTECETIACTGHAAA